MARNAQAMRTRAHPLDLRGLRRASRSIVVRVLDRSREVDCFQVSSRETLRAALRPIYRHLPAVGMSVEFTGVEEERPLLGLRRHRRETALAGLDDALDFLAA